MKKYLLLILFAFTFCLAVNAQTLEEEQETIKEVIQTAYIEGLINEGDPAKIDAGFHPAFELIGIGNGDEIWELPIYTWRSRALNDVKEGKKPKTGKELVTANFLSVDITGTAAVVKLEFLVGGKKTYVDYISLYRFESGWKIVGKIFYKLPEEQS